MAESSDFTLPAGVLRVLPSSDRGIVKPLMLVGAGYTDVDGLEESLKHGTPSFVESAHERGRDVCLVVCDKDDGQLRDFAGTVLAAVESVRHQRLGSARLIVGGAGRGALAAQYALAFVENQGRDHEVGLFYALNSTKPSAQEAAELDEVGRMPMQPHALQLISDSPDSTGDDDELPDDSPYHRSISSASASVKSGPLVPEDLTEGLLDTARVVS